MSCFELPGSESFDWSFDCFDTDAAESDNASPAPADPLYEFLRTVSGHSDEDAVNHHEDNENYVVPVMVNVHQEQKVVDLTDEKEEEYAPIKPTSSSYAHVVYEANPKKRSFPLDLDRWGAQPAKCSSSSLFDLDRRPVSYTTSILDHCLDKLRAETEEQYHVVSAMEALAEDSLFFDEHVEEPPLKRPCFAFVPEEHQQQNEEQQEDEDSYYEDESKYEHATPAMEEDEFARFLRQKMFMHTLERTNERIGMQNATLRRNLGMTRQQALESMAAEYAVTSPSSSSLDDDEHHLGDTDSDSAATEASELEPKLEMDEGTLAFLKKYIK